MDKIEISVGYLAALAGKTKDVFLDSITNEESGELIDNYEKVVNDEVKAKIISIREQQRKRGFKEGRKEVESLLETHSITDYESFDEALAELADKLKTTTASGQSKDGDKMTINEIKALPEVQQWLKGEVKALQDAKADLETQLSTQKAQFHNYKVGGTAKSKAFELLSEKKAVGLNQKSIDLFLKGLGTDNLDVAADGSIRILDSEGNPAVDSLHNPVTFEDYITSNWSFGFNEAPGNSKSASFRKGEQGEQRLVFRDQAHFEESLANATDAKQRAKIFNDFAAQQEEG